MGRRRLDINTILFPSLRYVSSPLSEQGSQTYRDALFTGTSSGVYSAQWGRKGFES